MSQRIEFDSWHGARTLYHLLWSGPALYIHDQIKTNSKTSLSCQFTCKLKTKRLMNLNCPCLPSHLFIFLQVRHVWDAEQPDARCHGSSGQHQEPGVWSGSGRSWGHHSGLPHGDTKGQSGQGFWVNADSYSALITQNGMINIKKKKKTSACSRRWRWSTTSAPSGLATGASFTASARSSENRVSRGVGSQSSRLP